MSRYLLALHLNPGHKEVDNTSLPLGWYLNPARHVPPLREAAAAAASACVLRDEHGVSAHRRLASIVHGVGWRKARPDESLAVRSDGAEAFLVDEALIERRRFRLLRPPSPQSHTNSG